MSDFTFINGPSVVCCICQKPCRLTSPVCEACEAMLPPGALGPRIETAADATRYECGCGSQAFEVVMHEGQALLCCKRCDSYHPRARMTLIDGEAQQ